MILVKALIGDIEYLGPSHYPNSLKAYAKMFEEHLLQYGTLHLYKVIVGSLSFFLTKNSVV